MSFKQQINSISKSKDGKTLIENFFSLSLLQIAGYVFPLITLPYLARVIGVDKFGEIAFALSVVICFQTVTDWGFGYTATRDIAKNKDSKEAISRIFCNVMSAKLLLLLVSVMVFTICVYAIPYLRERQLILWVTFVCVPGSLMFPDWFFQGIEKMKYITIMNVLSKLVFTILVFIVIKKQQDYIYQPLLHALAFFVNGIIALWVIFKKFHVRLVVPSFSDIWISIKSSSNMFVSLLLPNLYTNFSVILLNVYVGPTATGIYSAGKKFIDLFDRLSSVLSRTFFPFLARRIEKHKLYVKISGAISLLMGLFLFCGADLLVKIFYMPEFREAAVIIRIMSVAPLFLFLMNTYGVNYLVLVGKENILRNIIGCCSVLGFIMSWLAVPTLSYIGVAVTITSIWGIRGGLTYFFAVKFKKRDNG